MAVLVPLLPVLQAIRVHLSTLRLVQPGAPWDGELAFERVALYPVSQFGRALKDLIEKSSNRVALIVPHLVERKSERAGFRLKVRHAATFYVLVGDKAEGDFDAAAAFSDAALSTPGAEGLCDAVAQALDGQTFDFQHVALEPGPAEPLDVTNEAGKGRSVISMTYRTELGASDHDIRAPRPAATPGPYGNNVPPLATESGQIIIDG